MTLAPFALRGHNPDVLTCIANLSNDEVFTPPEFANQMLDTLAAAWADANDGADIWANPDVTFLDPFTKSGVFLREIVRRLVPRQVVGRISSISKLGMVGSARPMCTSIGRFQAIASCGRTSLYSIR